MESVEAFIDWTLNPPKPKPKADEPVRSKRPPLTREQAEAISRDLKGYDGRIKAGRLVD